MSSSADGSAQRRQGSSGANFQETKFAGGKAWFNTVEFAGRDEGVTQLSGFIENPQVVVAVDAVSSTLIVKSKPCARFSAIPQFTLNPDGTVTASLMVLNRGNIQVDTSVTPPTRRRLALRVREPRTDAAHRVGFGRGGAHLPPALRAPNISRGRSKH
jgi:hypothetical protein